jgi:hypothetical protein
MCMGIGEGAVERWSGHMTLSRQVTEIVERSDEPHEWEGDAQVISEVKGLAAIQSRHKDTHSNQPLDV